MAAENTQGKITLTEAQLRRSIYSFALMAFLLPPFVGGSLMGLMGFYPLPEFYLIFLHLRVASYVASFILPSLALVPYAARYLIGLTQMNPAAARPSVQRVLFHLPWVLFLTVSLYSSGGVLSADFTLEDMGMRQYTVRDHLFHQFGLIPVVLITAFPIFFFFIDRLGRYLAPRGVVVTAIPLWMKLLMLGIVTPLLIDSILVGYFLNQTGYFSREILLLWFSLLLLAAGGTWLAWRSLRQGISPLQDFITSRSGTISERAKANLTAYSLDEFGVLTARYAELLGSQETLAVDLQRSQLLANSVVDNAGALVVLLDRNGRIVRFNHACETLSGYTFAEIEDKFSWDVLLPPENAKFVSKNAFEALAHNPQAMSGKYTNAWVSKNGERYLIDWHNTLLLDAEGKMEFMVSVGTDVTQRRRIEEANSRLVERLDLAISAAKMGIWDWDIVNNQLVWDDQMFSLYGVKKEDFKGAYEAWTAALHPDDLADANETVQRALRNEISFDTEFRIRWPDGAVRHIRALGRVVRDAEGVPIRILGVNYDVTEIAEAKHKLRCLNVELEQRVEQRTASLNAAKEEAEHANAVKSQFLSRMSHELRTPLNAVLGFGELLQTDTALDAEQRDSASEIVKAGQHLLQMVNEILELNRIESGVQEVRLEPVPVAPMIEACAAAIWSMASQRGISVALEPGEPCAVQADRQRLEEVLLNLLTNAVKYNRDGGHIRISCTPAAEQRLRISVHDTGRGIAAAALPRLFKPFERLESAYEAIDGTGIGLALTKRLVDAMHGEVGVVSVQGEGSTFWFELPLAAAPAAANDSRRKILYVEDNPSNLQLMRAIIATRNDLELLAAVNAEAGLEIAISQHPEIILMDINLPGMDGFAALRRLRDHPATRDIPVIAVTANAMARDVERGKQAGFADYLTKPLEVGNLLQTLDRLLAG